MARFKTQLLFFSLQILLLHLWRPGTRQVGWSSDQEERAVWSKACWLEKAVFATGVTKGLPSMCRLCTSKTYRGCSVRQNCLGNVKIQIPVPHSDSLTVREQNQESQLEQDTYFTYHSLAASTGWGRGEGVMTHWLSTSSRAAQSDYKD